MSKSSVYSIRISYQLLNAIFEELDHLEINFNSVSGSLVSFIETKVAELGSDLSISDEEAIELVASRVSLCGKQTLEKKKKDLMSGLQPSKGSSKVRTALQSGAVMQVFDGPATNNDFAPSMNSNFEMNLESPIEDESGERRKPQSTGFGIDEVLSKGREIIEQQTREADESASDDLEQILQDSIAKLDRENNLALLEKLTGGFSIAKAQELPATLSKAKALSSRDPRLEKDKLWKAFSGEQDEAKLYALRIVYYNLPEEFWSTEKAEQMLIQVMENLT